MDITQRAVLYVGYVCNANCDFCYYKYVKKKKWKNLALAKLEALIYKNLFGNNRVDITGGEPTIYPHILELVQFCKKIGLRPSIITNGIALADEKKVLDLKQAGVFDYLLSVHGLGKIHDELVGISNATIIQQNAIKNLTKNKIPIRINVTVTKHNASQLLSIAKYAVKINARVVNFICFNPFSDWTKFNRIEFQEKHSIIAPNLKKAINFLTKNKVESNLRYFPFCTLKGVEDHQYNFSQMPYDSHEWDFLSYFQNLRYFLSFLLDRFFFKNYKKSPKKYSSKQAFFLTKKMGYKKSIKCKGCALTSICDGLTRQYSRCFGDYELHPYNGEKIKDPTFFIKKQFKIKD